jgi:hypothetical protein
MVIDASALTTGKAAYIYSDSSDTGAHQLLHIQQDNASAVNAEGIHIKMDGGGVGINYESTGYAISGSSSSTGSFGSVHTAGYVGIGTTGPNGVLHLQDSSGTAYFRMDSRVTNSSEGWYFKTSGTVSTTTLEIGNRWGSDTPRITALSSGKVGIGTTAPADLLHLSSSGHTEMSLDRATTAHDAALKYRTGGTTNWQIGTGITGTESDLTFNDGSDHVLILKSDNSATFAGGVGINGVTSNSVKALHVTSAGGDGSAAIHATNTSTSGYQGRAGYFIYEGSQNLGMAIIASAAGATSNWALYASSGDVYIKDNLSIGHSAATSPLHVSSSVASTTPSVHIEGSGSSVVAVDGTNGRLFSVSDEMEGSIFSANTIAGMPVIDAKSDYTTNFGGDVLPSVNAVHDLGSSAKRWNTVYTSDLSLKNKEGDWTIVEGEDDLFLYNNKKGKTYKFNLTEVDASEVPPKGDE